MKTAAVIIDKWKLPIFSKRLREAGYSYDTGPGVDAETTLLKVKCEFIADLQPVIEVAQKECAAKKGKK